MAGAEIHASGRVFQRNIVRVMHVDIGEKLLQIEEHPRSPVIGQDHRICPGMKTLQERPEGLDGGNDHLLVERGLSGQFPGYRVDQLL